MRILIFLISITFIIFVSMETNQDQSPKLVNAKANTRLRESVKSWCLKQKTIASEIPMSSVHFNYWIKDKKDLGPKSIEKVEKWHEDKKKALFNEP